VENLKLIILSKIRFIMQKKDKYGDYPLFLEWIPFDRFKDVKQIGEGGFAKVYSTKLIDGRANFIKQNDGNLNLNL
jgi:hypothetical protein